MTPGQLIVAYHGCDATTRDDLVSGRLLTLNPSRNRYDWLGEGIYFFEGDIDRALMFAHNSHQNPRKMYTRRAIGTPAVVGAALCIKHCLDMTTQWGVKIFCGALHELTDALEREGLPQPTNEAVDAADQDILLRNLDAAVFNVIRKANFGTGMEAVQAVRGAFHQGKELAPRSGFRHNSHIQIAVRDPACIVGWFLPPGVEQLSEEAYSKARESRKKIESDRKPRRRATLRAGCRLAIRSPSLSMQVKKTH
ncbi:hypothetical protein [Bordetella sp. LUAb4]|uniref:hypothetical protein n=1 Tax=Bordetella sp. LUAb4 TaxID=2843195 RepID=UPI001E47F0F0|nr:hypothetical protein [Bordetella sp. LUAb4]